ncbi:hypothetical protein LZG00_01565 [Rhodobacteraceae bacterium LMO-12]|nr:hypothetical protein [Rhodobacteraceae bacterium LMO-JJ12]
MLRSEQSPEQRGSATNLRCATPTQQELFIALVIQLRQVTLWVKNGSSAVNMVCAKKRRQIPRQTRRETLAVILTAEPFAQAIRVLAHLKYKLFSPSLLKPLHVFA